MIKGAAKAFVEIGAPAVEPLVAALKDEHNMWAAEVLGMIGDARAVEPLIAALQNDDQDVRKQALEALDKIGWHPAGDEISARYWITNGRYAECIRIGAPAVGPLIAATVSRSDLGHLPLRARTQVSPCALALNRSFACQEPCACVILLPRRNSR